MVDNIPSASQIHLEELHPGSSARPRSPRRWPSFSLSYLPMKMTVDGNTLYYKRQIPRMIGEEEKSMKEEKKRGK